MSAEEHRLVRQLAAREGMTAAALVRWLVLQRLRDDGRRAA